MWLQDSRVKSLTRALKEHDRDLFAERAPNGRIDVYRKCYEWDNYSYEGKSLRVLVKRPHIIISLTEDWRPESTPVNWGIEPVLLKLKMSDGWNRDIYSMLLANRERDEKTRARSRQNEFRALAADARRDFAKATNDFNVSTLDKNKNLLGDK